MTKKEKTSLLRVFQFRLLLYISLGGSRVTANLLYGDVNPSSLYNVFSSCMCPSPSPLAAPRIPPTARTQPSFLLFLSPLPPLPSLFFNSNPNVMLQRFNNYIAIQVKHFRQFAFFLAPKHYLVIEQTSRLAPKKDKGRSSLICRRAG